MSMSLLIPALLMGFLGSPHCMGMCGGIVTAFGISIKQVSPQKQALLIGSYHAGRLISYTMLGVVASLFGEQILAPFLTDNAMPRLVLGFAIVFAALLMLGVPFLNRLEKVGLGLWNALAPIRQKVLPMNTIPKALSAGLLWGLLPCGLVYGALVMSASISATTHHSGMGALFMLFFGFGTLPALVLTGTALSWLQAKVKAFNIRKFSGAIMLVSGLLIAFSPTVMHHLHGGHGHGHHGHHAHSSVDNGHHGDAHHNHTMEQNPEMEHNHHMEHQHHHHK
ncbi:MAG: sulfite exporter TauE/SafE family protein [Moraxella sp.]|nr:MAG: sulfite exporter TauE/SafE family protein [Moraxella sp.]